MEEVLDISQQHVFLSNFAVNQVGPDCAFLHSHHQFFFELHHRLFELLSVEMSSSFNKSFLVEELGIDFHIEDELEGQLGRVLLLGELEPDVLDDGPFGDS